MRVTMRYMMVVVMLVCAQMMASVSCVWVKMSCEMRKKKAIWNVECQLTAGSMKFT